MKFFISSLAIITCLSGCLNLNRSEVHVDYLFENVNVVPMNEDIVLSNKIVAVKDGKIVAIADQSKADKFTSNNRIDGKGRYLMPGLSDMHVHVRWNPDSMFKLFIANGVTTVANARIADGEGDYDHTQFRSDIKAGRKVGPRYIVGGQQLKNYNLPTIEAIAPVLDDHVTQGYDFVKIHGDLKPEVFDALMAEIRARNLRVTGHSQHLQPLSQTLKMDSIEHMEEFLYVSRDPNFAKQASEDFIAAYRVNVEGLKNPEVRANIVHDIKASGIFIDATLLVYNSIRVWASDEHLTALKDDERVRRYIEPSVRDFWLSFETNPYQKESFPLTPEDIDHNMKILLTLTKEFNDAGVPILLGTDTFGTLIPGFSIHKELALMIEAGLTPYEALRTGTVNPAAYLNEGDSAGQIRNGFRADFILLDGNPLHDVTNAGRVSGVFTNEHWYARSDIDALLKEVEQPH